MFKKLKNKFLEPRLKIGECVTMYDKSHCYYDVEGPALEEFYAVIPERFRDKFQVSYFTVSRNILPHHDNGATTAINFYLSTDKATGTFYNTNVGTPNILRLGKNGGLYNPKELSIAGSYVAENSEAYLLDVTKPHSVTFNSLPAFRSALAFRTSDFTFDEVYEMLVETDNI